MNHLRMTMLALMVIFLGACSFGSNSSSPSGPGTVDLNINAHSSCQSSTGQPTTCTISLQSAATSTASFDWTASSDPIGASFNPDAGTVPIGGMSGTIQVSIPDGICPDELMFTDASHHTTVKLKINTACQ